MSTNWAAANNQTTADVAKPGLLLQARFCFGQRGAAPWLDQPVPFDACQRNPSQNHPQRPRVIFSPRWANLPGPSNLLAALLAPLFFCLIVTCDNPPKDHKIAMDYGQLDLNQGRNCLPV
ncbi:hypothetical protein [Aestuariibius sp. HNIBRBA575]|uniref:hypothetical protein n=1 Tax=Aestuariibius sp. HNIBRBA575 TaxID=3233343 RepID=UPI0034A463DB